jgi:metallo-beta-lactamase family protein
MQLTFHGAVNTVTGSKHLLEVNGTKILLDCGFFQGRRAESYEQNQHFPFDASEIDILILSHAHIDHSGAIPNLIKRGFTGDIICTSATRDLCATMLPDSGYIQERDVEYINKHRKRKKLPLVEPIYTQADAHDALNYFTTRNYHRPREIAKGVTLTFHDAGHMLGSAITQLDIIDHDDNREKCLVFSGDLGREGIPIIRDPEVLHGCDILIMESTYGNRTHEPYFDSQKKLERIVTETYQKGGSIIMPSFAVGRTQQLVFTLHQLMEAGDIPRIPIFVDSPLAIDATAVFRLHPEVYDDEIRAFMEANGNPFGFDDLTYVRKHADSKRLNFLRDPCIIISASGMAEFGRILHHLANRIGDPNNTILITGWQAPYTLGRRLVDGAEQVRIFGKEFERKAKVEVLNGFSGHADQNELTSWVGAMHQRPERVFLVHGELDSAQNLQRILENKFFDMRVTIPSKGNAVKL